MAPGEDVALVSWGFQLRKGLNSIHPQHCSYLVRIRFLELFVSVKLPSASWLFVRGPAALNPTGAAANMGLNKDHSCKAATLFFHSLHQHRPPQKVLYLMVILDCELGRPLAYLTFSLMALIGDHIY